MQLTTKLTQFVLQQALGDLGNQAVTWLETHYTDPTKALPAAIDDANTRTWRVLELALTGDSLAGWLRQKLASGAERGILQPLRDWLKGQGEPFLRACRTELRAASAAGLLTPDGTGKELIAAWGVAGVAEPSAVVADAQALMTEVNADLQDYYPNLALFLAGPDVNLLPAIFGYFLRQAIIERPNLRETLNFERIAQVKHGQASGFAALSKLLSEQGAALMEELARFDLGLEGVAQNQAEIAAMLRQIHAALPTSARVGGVSPRLSAVLRSASDMRLLTELEQRLQNLPPESRSPEVLDAVGRMAMAVGVFDTAYQRFQQAAVAAHARGAISAEAEAQYNAYRALLEQRQFTAALTALQTAAQLAPEAYAPFPLHKYVPQQILGAGGFGVAFLCLDQHFNEPVVIKTLYRAELERDIAEVFREGRILRKLRHPGIIEVNHCDYADAGHERPYLVMEYFAGQSLTAYLEQYGTLSLEQALALARLVAEALQAAHEQNIWHRDLKPDNLLVRWEQDAWQIKVIDFGLAVAGTRVLQTVAAGNTSQSILGQSLGGTFQYSAPEQLGTGAGKIGPWSDVYAFGKTLSQALFKTTQPSKKNYRALGEHPFADLLSDCMEQLPAERPQNFVEVLQQLSVGELVEPPRPEPVEGRTASSRPLPSTSSGNVLPPLQPLPPLPPVTVTNTVAAPSKFDALLAIDRRVALMQADYDKIMTLQRNYPDAVAECQAAWEQFLLIYPLEQLGTDVEKKLHIAAALAKRQQEEQERKRQQEEQERKRREEFERGTVKHGHYLIHPDGTVTDTRTKLMWKRCAEGQTWDGKTCVGEAKGMTWDEIMPQGKQKSWPSFAGQDDWRVPTLDELKSLVFCSSGKPQLWNDTGKGCEGDYQKPTIDQTAFPNTPGRWFWTASPYTADSSALWIVHFNYGGVSYDDRGSNRAVRIVRGGQ